MNAKQVLPEPFASSPVEPAEAARGRALSRLTDLIERGRTIEAMAADDRPVPLPLMRRAVFAAYRAAIKAGAAREARRIVHGV